MKHLLLISIVLLSLLACTYQNKAIAPLVKNEPVKNVLFLIIDDLRPELKSFGASHIHSPNIDELAKNSRVFLNQYVNAPSCGPSRYSMLTGRYGPPQNNALILRGNAILAGDKNVPVSMPQWFKQQGYTTVSVGKVSHHPGGLGGKNWHDVNKVEMPNAWTRHLMPVGEWHSPMGMMHGLANGEVRKNPQDMDVFQAVSGGDNIYPDGLITDEAIKQLNLLSQARRNLSF
ncbi:MAG: sulfatase-like hydrolase/transferase [Thalassotalea sp.]